MASVRCGFAGIFVPRRAAPAAKGNREATPRLTVRSCNPAKLRKLLRRDSAGLSDLQDVTLSREDLGLDGDPGADRAGGCPAPRGRAGRSRAAAHSRRAGG